MQQKGDWVEQPTHTIHTQTTRDHKREPAPAPNPAPATGLAVAEAPLCCGDADLRPERIPPKSSSVSTGCKSLPMVVWVSPLATRFRAWGDPGTWVACRGPGDPADRRLAGS